MRNSNAKAVAQKVIEQINNNELPNITQAMKQVGYSKHTARTQQKRVTQNKAYISEIKSFTDQLDDIIADSIEQIKAKKLKGTYRDHVESVDKLKKLQNLLNGRPTENNSMVVKWEE